MDRVWITNGSTSIAPVVNPLTAACHRGYVPTDIYVLNNPIINDVTDAATSLMKTIVTAHGGEEPTITVETIEKRKTSPISEHRRTRLPVRKHLLLFR